MKIAVSPLELCVALGLVNPSVLEAQDEHEADCHPDDGSPDRDDCERIAQQYAELTK